MTTSKCEAHLTILFLISNDSQTKRFRRKDLIMTELFCRRHTFFKSDTLEN